MKKIAISYPADVHIVDSGILALLKAGLEDYTTDERGEVGHTIRIACLDHLAAVLESGILDEVIQKDTSRCLFLQILKQSTERLDVVREHSGVVLMRCLRTEAAWLSQVTACVGVFTHLAALKADRQQAGEPSMQRRGETFHWSLS